ncbi:MAG: NapC/NirT family cytochrome c [Thermodesulfovibrionia bacterium]|nr:NapC/NirT family cytochrome c [Thermodesulfovibrionia bacterium]
MGVRTILLILLVIGALTVAGIVGSEWYTAQPGFCNRCHIMNRYYNTWKEDKHSKKDVACVDCHYAPGQKLTVKAKLKGLRHLTTYFTTSDKEARTPARVPDSSCTTSQCHPKEKFFDKKIKFTEKIFYIHKTHEEKTIEGQKLHCDTCHLHVTREKHFEVPREACYLCHFKNAGFNEGRSKCSLCHEVPTKTFVKEGGTGGKLISHQTLEKDKVPCWSCHYQLIQGTGEIKEKECLNCHEKGETLEVLKKENKKEILHKAHVGEQNAKCFNCHDYIDHKEAKELAYLDVAISSCATCHSEPHLQQKLLIAGIGGKGIDKPYPIKHYDVKISCLACHTEEGYNEKGIKIKKAVSKTCVACHTKEQELLSKQWGTAVLEELKEAKRIEKETIAVIENAKGKLPEKNIKKAIAMLKDGQENLRIVDAGGGVHNKKYSTLLIETAVENFEGVIEELKDKK